MTGNEDIIETLICKDAFYTNFIFFKGEYMICHW